jgi:hypothetical protein
LTRGPLGDWYAHLLWIERKKCILFTNELTLFNFIALDVKKAGLADMNTFFRENLRRGLEAIGIVGASASKLLLTLNDITISKTTNRSVLGSMNDYAFQYRVYVETQGGLHRCDILDMISSINETPMSAIGYDSGTQRLRRWLDNDISDLP